MQAKRKLTALLLSLCSIVDRRVIYSFRKIDTVYVIWPGNFLFENSSAFLRSTANSIKTTPQLHLNSTSTPPLSCTIRVFLTGETPQGTQFSLSPQKSKRRYTSEPTGFTQRK